MYRLKKINSHVKQGSYKKNVILYIPFNHVQFFMFNRVYHQLRNSMFKLILNFSN